METNSDEKDPIKDPIEETFDEKKERYETPEDVYYKVVSWIRKMGLPPPNLDLMASVDNSKCMNFLDKEYDALHNELLIDGVEMPDAGFLNCPHKLYHEMTRHVDEQYHIHGYCTYALIPSRNERTVYWHDIIERNRFGVVEDGYIFYFPTMMRIIFEIDHKQASTKDGKVYHDPNGYKLVIWIGKKYLETFKENLQKFYKWYYDENETIQKQFIRSRKTIKEEKDPYD